MPRKLIRRLERLERRPGAGLGVEIETFDPNDARAWEPSERPSLATSGPAVCRFPHKAASAEEWVAQHSHLKRD